MAGGLLWATRAASYLRISVPFRAFSSGKINGKPPHTFHCSLIYDMTLMKGLGLAEDKQVPKIDRVVKDLKYVDSHEWAKVDGNLATIGITDHAQDHLGDVVYVELPEVGANVSQGGSFGAVESVKATSDINSPVSGKVVEVNGELSSSPGLVNGSPYEKGWIIKVEISNPSELNSLMDSEQYSKFCEEEDAKH